MADGIYYSGIPVLLDIDDRVRAFFEQRWPPSAWPFAYGKTDAKALAYPFFQKSRAGIFTSPYPECPAPGINELVIPSNAGRYAKALVIVDREFLEAFIDDPTTGKWPSEEPRDFRIQYNDHAVVWGMYALTPIRCDATINANLWMLPLVDERYFWNRSYSTSPGFSIPSWQDLINDIADSIGKSRSKIQVFGGINEAYGVPDQEVIRDAHSSFGNLLDVVAMSIGKRCFYTASDNLADDGLLSLYPPGMTSVYNMVTTPTIADRIIHGGPQCDTQADPPVAAYSRLAYDYWGNVDDLNIAIPDFGDRIGNHVIRCAWWYQYERNELGYATPMPGTDTAWNAFRQQLQADMTAWGSYPFAITTEGVSPYMQPNTYIDYHSYKCERLRTGQMSVTTTITGLPPDFAPYVNIAQRPGVYIHPHEVARFIITEETNDYGYAKGLIIKSLGPYDEGEVPPIRILAEATEDDIGKVVTCHYDHGRDGSGWREIKPQGENELVKFRTTSGIFNRIANAVVLGGDNNGDTIELHDPNNLWPNITINCIGFAKQRVVGTSEGSGSGSSGGSGSGSGSNPPANVRWEIVTCSLPVNEIRVELQDTLLAKAYSPGELKAVTTASYFLRSTYPDVMKPAQCNASAVYEWDTAAVAWVLRTPCPFGCESTPPPPPASSTDPGQFATVPCVVSSEQIEIEFQNTWLLDGMCESYAVLRRVTNAGWGSPIESTPNFGSATDAYWEVVLVERRKARYILFEYQGEDTDPDIEKWWQGENPVTECDDELEIEYPLGEPCIGDKVIATYDPKLDVYYGYVTKSAMYGEGIEIDPVIDIANQACGITMTQQPVTVFKQKKSQGECESEPFDVDVQLGVSTPVVLAISSESCGTINYAYQNVRLWTCESEIGFSQFPINFDGVKFVTGGSFGPRSCTGSAEWTWNTGTNDWDLTTPCSSGCETAKPTIPTPLPTGTITQTTPCDSPANGQCGLNLELRSICDIGSYGSGPAEIVHVPLPLEELIVSGEIYKAPGEIVIERWKIFVCNFEAQPDDSIPLYTCPPEGGGSSGGT